MKKLHMWNIWHKMDRGQLLRFLTRFLVLAQAPVESYVTRYNLACSIQDLEVWSLAQMIREAAYDAVDIELTTQEAAEDAAVLWAAIQQSWQRTIYANPGTSVSRTT